MSDDIALPPPATQRSRSTTTRASSSQHPVRQPSYRRPANDRHGSTVSRLASTLRSATPDTNGSHVSLRSRLVASLHSNLSDEELGSAGDDGNDPTESELDTDDNERVAGLTSLVQNLSAASGSSMSQDDVEEKVRRRVRQQKRQAQAQAKRDRKEGATSDDQQAGRSSAGGEPSRTRSRRRRRDDGPDGPSLPTVPETDRRSRPSSRPSSSKRRSSPPPTASGPPSSSRRKAAIANRFDDAARERHEKARDPKTGDFKDAHPRDRYARFDQNLNEPFLPPTDEEKHNLGTRFLAPVWNKLTGYERASAVGMNASTPGTGSLADNRNSMSAITALITTTGNIVGVASPILGTIGPAWEGQDTSNGHGHRRLARYGRREAVDDSEAQEALEVQYKRNRALERREERAERRTAHRKVRHDEKAAINSARSSGDATRVSQPSKGGSSPDHRSVRADEGGHEADDDQDDNGGDDNVDHEDEMSEELAQVDADEVVKKEGDGSEVKEGAGKVPPPHETTIPDVDDDSGSSTEAVSDDTSDGVADLEKGQGQGQGQGTRSDEYAGWIGSKRGERQQQEIFITRHRASHAQTREFIVRLANALMLFGAPTHRIEANLESAARVLELDAHFFYLPGIMVMSFNRPDQETSETAFLRSSGGLDVQSLRKVHVVARGVMHDHIGAAEGARRLKRITGAPPRHAVWQRIVIVASCSFFASSVVFSGSFLDMWASAILGGLMGTCQHTLAAWNPLFSNCFEIAMAFLISFFAKALSASGYFCYASLTSAGIVMILPGYVLLTATLELASKVLVPGSIRLVFGVILSLFLGTGISLGSKVYVLIDPEGSARASSLAASSASGDVVCARSGHEPWYQADISPWFLFITLPGFIISLALWTKARLKTQQSAATFVIACLAYTSYYFAKQVLDEEPEVTSAIGAGVVGLLGTLWSRIARGTAFTTQSAAILLLVPNGLAAAGGIVMSSSSGTESFKQGAEVALRQIQTSVGITIGLFVASLVTYLGSRKKRGTILSY